jgi:hypothetical protein
VDEIVVATFADSAEDRLRSYQMLADMFDLKNSLTPQTKKIPA